MPELCHHSCYHLVLVCEDNPIELNDLIELGEYPQIKNKSVLKVILDRYDVRTGRLHVKRFRQVLNFPPPGSPPGLGGPDKEKDDGEKKGVWKKKSLRNTEGGEGGNKKKTAAEKRRGQS